MRAFACSSCRSLVFFENSVCVTCNSALGYLRPAGTLVNPVLSADRSLTYRYAGSTYRPCRNLALAGCNWLAPDGAPNELCDSCSLTRTRPADNDLTGLAAFVRAETAKRRLLFQLDDLGLPTTPRSLDSQRGLAFDLLSSTHQPVVTGHVSGIITIDLAEGDDGHREMLRLRLAQPYRTMLGHFRHEAGHWYWDALIEGSPSLDRFDELFGDQTQDYPEALARYYTSGPASDWPQHYVSRYATAHPWEDWAETFAHYLHIRDTLQTASAYGVSVAGPDVAVSAAADAVLRAEPADLAGDDFDKIITTWLALTLALNAVNRSMGRDDLYPFVLSPAVVEKLRFVHEVVTARTTTR